MVPTCFINMYTPKGHLDIQLTKTTEHPPGAKNLERLEIHERTSPALPCSKITRYVSEL